MASSKNRQPVCSAAAFILIVGYCGPARAVEFAGGTGAADDPYQIATAEQLLSIGSDANLLNKHFVLVADIDLDPNLPGGRVFDRAAVAPDVDDAQTYFQGTAFTGSFDGDGHVVKNLHINSAEHYLALVGYVGSRGQIRNLHVEGAHVIGANANYAGCLVAQNDGKVIGCSSEGFVTGIQRVGGLAGRNDGQVQQCEASVQVVGSPHAGCVGGLVGWNRGTVQSCHAAGAVAGELDVGGLVGLNLNVVRSCYATGPVTGQTGVGGLVGENGRSDSMGLNGLICFCYATGRATGTKQVGGFVGYSPGTTGCSMWDIETSGWPYGEGAIGLTSAQMKDAAVFSLNGWDSDPNWVIEDGNDYPRLAWEGSRGVALGEPNLAWLDGSGTARDSYKITTADQLCCLSIAGNLWNRHIVLMADLDMTGKRLHPIGIPQGFRAVFEGNGHVIRNLTMDAKGANVAGIGLFGWVEREGLIRNLKIDNIAISVGPWSRYVGTLAGYSLGTIMNCAAEGTIADAGQSSYLGGLVGLPNTAIVMNSRAACVLTCADGSQYAGGLVGYNWKADIVNCLACSRVVVPGGLVIGTGGLVGKNDAGYIRGSFWDTDKSGISKGEGTGLITRQLQQMQTCADAGWDMVGERANGTADLWLIPAAGGYPELAVFSAEYERPVLQGSGSGDDPYRIATAEDLGAVSHYSSLACYRLEADVNLAGITWKTPPMPEFHGVFDGSGHSIVNLTVTGRRQAGVFGFIGPDGSVFDLAVDEAEVIADRYGWCVGVLAGRSSGELQRCSASGSVRGSDQVDGMGGLVGYNYYGTISACRAAAAVTDDGACQELGGLVGRDYSGHIQDSYAWGSVRAPSGTYVGGLVGYAREGEIECCYAATPLAGAKSLGGLVAYSNQAKITAGCWDTQVSGQLAGAAGMGLTTAQMQTRQSFASLGWDFADTWMICEGRDYPRLRWEGVECSE
jgi:hypothetical protein